MNHNKQPLILKHLEFIQAIIARMGQNSFQIKTWTIIVVSALVVLYANQSNEMYLYLSLAAVCVFWGLDGYYLHQERKFRQLYNQVVDDLHDGTDRVVPLSMNLDNEHGFYRWLCTCCSKTIICIYLPIILIIEICLTISSPT